MKKFELTPDMLTMSGAFYPKGYIFLMFADAADAAQVAQDIDMLSGPESASMLLTAESVLHDIGRIDGASNVALPSVGTEGATVHKYIDLARQGYSAVMVKVASDEDAKRVINSARKVPIAYGQRYHLLAMEDIE